MHQLTGSGEISFTQRCAVALNDLLGICHA
jgi:hypothetical protein